MEPHRWGASGGGQRVRRSPSSRAATAQFLEPVPCAWHSSRLWDTAANQRSRYPSLVMVSDNKQAPWNAARQASLSLTISWSLPKFISIELVMPSNHLILCCPLLLLPSVFPSIRVFSSELALHTRWPKYWSFSFSISSSKLCESTLFGGTCHLLYTIMSDIMNKSTDQEIHCLDSPSLMPSVQKERKEQRKEGKKMLMSTAIHEAPYEYYMIKKIEAKN
ncbi:uncharacterized protein LOC133048510 isoform X2 [Dama dama]|uniref:uncharacterized protein LOC133048510 isoform X2 n=1 Tax=Dama dama TaxID=30532 RepID=UPI002A359341|nr:uncharacterized protein LOC133048510 isoform X2 [Dama dama]